MKLKYKKIILLTTMSTMGIGLLTISLSHDKTAAEDNSGAAATMKAEVFDEESVGDDENVQVLGVADATSIAITTPTLAPTPTPLPVYPIEEEGYPKIEQLVKDYYTAKNNRDVEALKAISSDPSTVETQEDLQQKTEYIENYLDVKAYVQKGFKEGTYIVYAYHEIKFTGINTTAPGLSKFFVITDENNELKFFSGTMDEETQTYYNERSNDEDVVALMNLTNEKSQEAMDKDEDLKNFWTSVAEMANSKQNQEETKN
ncbi:MAG: hypothetical protein QM644_01545 [Mobilitalea sp.]